MRISARNPSCNPLWPGATGEEDRKSMDACAELAGSEQDTPQPEHIHGLLAGFHGPRL